MGGEEADCGPSSPAFSGPSSPPWPNGFVPVPGQELPPGRGTAVLVLGILSIVLGILIPLGGLVLGILAWVMGQREIAKMRAGQMDSAGEGNTRTGWICGIVGTCLGCVCGVGWFVLLSE